MIIKKMAGMQYILFLRELPQNKLDCSFQIFNLKCFTVFKLSYFLFFDILLLILIYFKVFQCLIDSFIVMLSQSVI